MKLLASEVEFVANVTRASTNKPAATIVVLLVVPLLASTMHEKDSTSGESCFLWLNIIQ